MISIILPVLGQDFYTQQILADIPNKIKSPYEIIYLDGPEGVNQKWNRGVENASGEYVMIINNDIVLTEGIDLQLIEGLNTHKIACPYTTEGKDKFFVPLVSRENNIAGWCFMLRKKDWIPIDDRLDIYYGDNWIYEKLDRDVFWGGIIHHYVSQTIYDPKIKDGIRKRVNRDHLTWNLIKDEICKQG